MIHGHSGSPDKEWFQYIKNNLKNHEIDVFIPQMPSEHTLEAWFLEAEKWKEKITENTILIGHSLGCPFILNLLASLEKPVFGTVFIAGFGTLFPEEGERVDVKKDCNSFVKNISWKKAKSSAGIIKSFASTNDENIPLEYSVNFGVILKKPVEFIKDAGHFRGSAGFLEFPELLEYLLSQVYLTYEEFKKLDARVGHIKKVEPIEGADKLLRFEIDFGEEEDRQIVSGIKEYFPDLPDGQAGYEALVGKKALYVLNLAPREIKGVTSYGMLMAVDGVDGNPVFLVPEQEVNPGSHVR